MMIFIKNAILAAVIVSTLASCGVRGNPEAPQLTTQN
jgi:predicted small lipoprotein YifL